MSNTFNHEKLDVYQRALAHCGLMEDSVSQWESRHAVKDQYTRAADSVVENLAAACASRTGSKLGHLDCSMGSVLECAACIDVARIKGLIATEEAHAQKKELARIFGMLIGLRRSWVNRNLVREERAQYGRDDDVAQEAIMFHHEELDVYQVGLELAEWLYGEGGVLDARLRAWRRLDALTTSIVLNIAEGNGKFTERDQRKFIQIAHESSIKMAAQIDLAVQKGCIDRQRAVVGKNLLHRIASMTAAMLG